VFRENVKRAGGAVHINALSSTSLLQYHRESRAITNG